MIVFGRMDMNYTMANNRIVMDKIDIDKLVTVRHYAEINGVVRETVMQRVRKGEITLVVIDGVNFIMMEEEKDEE